MIGYYEGIYRIVDVEELFYLIDMAPKELYRLKIKRFASPAILMAEFRRGEI